MTIRLGHNRRQKRRNNPRRGSVAVESALVFQLLACMLLATVETARAFHDLVILTDRARSGALAASLNIGTASQPMSDAAWRDQIVAAVVADRTELASSLTQVVIQPASLSSIMPTNPTVNITVSCPFQTILNFSGTMGQITISRTIQMRLQPTGYRMK